MLMLDQSNRRRWVLKPLLPQHKCVYVRFVNMTKLVPVSKKTVHAAFWQKEILWSDIPLIHCSRISYIGFALACFPLSSRRIEADPWLSKFQLATLQLQLHLPLEHALHSCVWILIKCHDRKSGRSCYPNLKWYLQVHVIPIKVLMCSCTNSRNNLLGKIEGGTERYSIEKEDNVI